MEITINSLFDSYMKDLDRLIRHESVYEKSDTTPFGQGIQDALGEVLNIAEYLGFRTYLDPEGYYAYAETGEGDAMFGVLGHLDVVPAGDKDLWNTDPFQLATDGQYLYGRGVADDKGPVLTSMYALKIALDEGLKLNQRVRFIFGGDEESLWRCMDAYVAKEEIPNKGFTPDSSFPLTYAEKGLIQFNLYSNEAAVSPILGGDAYNAVPDRSTIAYSESSIKDLDELNIEYEVIDDTILVYGKAMHAMAADQGINSNVLAAKALANTGETHVFVKYLLEQLSEPNGQLIFGDVADEMSGKLMLNAAIVKDSMIGIDIRYPVSVDKEFITQAMALSADKYGLRLEEYDYLRAIHMDQSSDFIQTLMSIYQRESKDYKSKPMASGGATYARAMDNIVAFGPAFEGHEQFEHQANERVLIENVKLAMRIYYHTFKELVFEK